MFRGVIFASLGLLASVLLAEALLRLAPVATGYNYLALNAQNPVLRGTAFFPYTYSEGWNFRLVSHGVLNNDGFISGDDYHSGSGGSGSGGTVLLIGDSFVQAAAVPETRNLHALLTRQLSPARVLGLGRAGGALPDYLAMARWGIGRYHPDALVFLIVTGDVDDSLVPKPGGYRFSKTASGYTLTRSDRLDLTASQRLLNRSMLFRYLYDNLAFTVNFPLRPMPPRTGLAGNSGELEKCREISAFFLSQLAQSFPPDKVVFLISRGRRLGSFNYDTDINVLRDVATERGFRVIDLAASFTAYEAQTGRRLDFAPVDTHWNELAQQVVAAEVGPVLRDTLGK